MLLHSEIHEALEQSAGPRRVASINHPANLPSDAQIHATRGLILRFLNEIDPAAMVCEVVEGLESYGHRGDAE